MANADIIVIGSGISGLAAAITAAEGGAKVLMFEKQKSLGGTSNFFQGIFAVESEIQRRKYIDYSKDQAFKNMMEYSHWMANGRLVRAIVDESGASISWLISKGVEFSDATINMPDAPRTYHVVKGEGAAAVKILATYAKEKGVEIITGAPVRRLIKEGSKISGVIADINDQETEFRAKAVVIASGGYANNKEWIRKYSGFDLDVNITPVGNTDKTGDGIRMAWEAGAAEEGMGHLELFRVGPFGPDLPMKNQMEFAASQPDLWVNTSGERFCDESIAFYDSSVGNANARYKEGYTYSLFDDSILKRMMERGVDRGMAIENPPGTKPLNIIKEMDAAISRNSAEIIAADSIEELAKKINIDGQVLKATIDEYNESCRKGHDALFAKDRKYLWEYRGPRYYAAKARTVFLGTMGGIKINHKIEVLDKKGKTIPGLYACGYDAGGMWGDSYSIKYSSGASSGFALNSGRLAGKNALKYIAIV